MPYKVFSDGDVLTAAEVMTYMMEQQIAVFADAAARDSSILDPIHGMICYIQSTQRFSYFNGNTWRSI